MKSIRSQSSYPSRSNNLNLIDGLIISLIILFIIGGVCLLAPVYFITHLVLNLIRSAKSKPTRDSLNQTENGELNDHPSTSPEVNHIPSCRVS